MKRKVTWSGFYSSYAKTIVNNNVQDKSGIYLLWVKLESGRWKVTYVGQAKNIRIRLLEHLSNNEENQCLKNDVNKYIYGFEYAIVSNKKDRDGVENYLYNYYEPECNQISPPKAQSIEINLPD